eukprot:3474366-Amphidinium_carterae.1
MDRSGIPSGPNREVWPLPSIPKRNNLDRMQSSPIISKPFLSADVVIIKALELEPLRSFCEKGAVARALLIVHLALHRVLQSFMSVLSGTVSPDEENIQNFGGDPHKVYGAGPKIPVNGKRITVRSDIVS